MLFGKYVNKYYKKHFFRLLAGILTLIVVDYVQLIIPSLYRMVIQGLDGGSVIVDGTEVPFDIDFLLDKICLPMIFIILVMVTGRFLWRIFLFGTGVKVESDLRSRLFDKCKDLSQEFYSANKVGNLMSLFTNDLETIHEAFGTGIMMFADAIFLGVLAFIKMFNMDWTLTLLTMLPMSLMLGAVLVVSRYMTLKWTTRQEAFSSLSDFSQESFGGIAVIKAFVKETKELLAFKKINKDNEKANVEYTKLSVACRVLIFLFVETVICVILGYGGYLVYNGSFDAAELVEFIGYFQAIVWPVIAVSELIEMVSKGKASLARITELLDREPDVKDEKNVSSIGEIKGDIEFKNLTFRYPDGDYDSLKNISLKINAGENVGIIGNTGCGKTTLVDLILRIYNVPDETLFIDGYDVNSLPIKEVRGFAAYVPQDNFLFSDTIENNIAFAKDECDLDNVRSAAALADIDSNIQAFVDGYSTVLGERGVTVSGGQKQRISIARALIKNAPILILDDSVSAVDVATEKTIIENLSKTRKGKTTILTAHRVSTVEAMDKIVFMQDGYIIDVGTHNELYERCEKYRSTVEFQRLESKKEAGK